MLDSSNFPGICSRRLVIERLLYLDLLQLIFIKDKVAVSNMQIFLNTCAKTYPSSTESDFLLPLSDKANLASYV